MAEVPIQFGVRRHGRSKLQWADYIEFALNLRRLRGAGASAESAPL
ncbi:MAG: hypothetical protein ACRD01_07880 [Terriglobales bacterium]